jgi:hypothetical protein
MNDGNMYQILFIIRSKNDLTMWLRVRGSREHEKRFLAHFDFFLAGCSFGNFALGLDLGLFGISLFRLREEPPLS